MVVTDRPISNTARSENWPDARSQTVPESNIEPQEYVSIAEYLRGIQQRNVLALDRLGQLLKTVIGVGPEIIHRSEEPDSMTEHVKQIFNEACDIEDLISRLAYALGISI